MHTPESFDPSSESLLAMKELVLSMGEELLPILKGKSLVNMESQFGMYINANKYGSRLDLLLKSVVFHDFNEFIIYFFVRLSIPKFTFF